MSWNAHCSILTALRPFHMTGFGDVPTAVIHCRVRAASTTPIRPLGPFGIFVCSVPMRYMGMLSNCGTSPLRNGLNCTFHPSMESDYRSSEFDPW